VGDGDIFTGEAGGSGPTHRRVAIFGGVYSNHRALSAALRDMARREVDAVYCLGDLGAFGPHPDRTCEILREARIPVVRGNYDDSLARGLDDCQCGYTDPRDNHFARISYRYTFAHTSPRHRRWMDGFPAEIRFRLGDLRVLACHGSPRRTNEFLWESTTPTHFLEGMARDHDADVMVGTHTGLHWMRRFAAPGEPPSVVVGLGAGDGGGEGVPAEAGEAPRSGAYVNVGALGRPANDGRTEVWYALLEARGRELDVDFVPVAYDHRALAREMRDEELPEEFVETILTGWWTTCLEVLPGKERARGRH
jgi:predicted phosphodiesterase